MLSDLQRVQLGSFLHDIGKFWQRTGEPHNWGFASFTRDDLGDHGAHAKWSASFFDQHVPSEFRQAAYPALYHHKPNDYVSKIVAVADRLSATERDDSSIGSGPQQLVSPFCGVSLHSQDGVKHKYYPLSALSIDPEIIFPTEPTANDVEAAYRVLWNEFLAEHRLLPNEDFDAYFHSLYYLLFKYGWCIPSAFYRDVPDISLFDHSRTTCAIATSLVLQGVAEADLDALLLRDRRAGKEPMFTLIGGDLSGIQKFLYTLTAEGAARGLRCQSFYLQLLNDTVARWVLSHLGLSICNLLYCGGGRFYILAPLKAKSSLAPLREQLCLKLLEAHGAELYLALDGIELSPASLSFETGEAEDFGAMWWSVGERLNQVKRRKFAELAPDELVACGAAGADACQGGRINAHHRSSEDGDAETMRRCKWQESLDAVAWV